MGAKLCYKDADGFIQAWGHMPGLTAGAGETVVDYDGDIIDYRYKKVDLGALPTISLIDKTAGEQTQYDDDNNPVTGAQIQTAYATKSTDADRIAFLNGVIKHMADGTATKTNIDAL